jgi:hypothetical protein
VSSDKDLPVNFKIRYLVNEAGWIASYDLVAPDINKPVTLKYKAQVYNNTAIDWTDVKLTLSTSDPSLAASRPYLTTWTLNYTSMANEGLLENKALQYNNDLSDSAIEYDDIAVAELSTSFDIAQRHSVLANGEFHRLDLINESLNATFEYVAVPKVDECFPHCQSHRLGKAEFNQWYGQCIFRKYIYRGIANRHAADERYP